MAVLNLMLRPDAKLRHMFWMAKVSDEVWSLVLEKPNFQQWIQDIEAYRFGETFSFGEAKSLDFSWSLSNKSLNAGRGAWEASKLTAFLPYTQLQFKEGASSQPIQEESWLRHRARHLLAEPQDFREPRLVFELGLDSYCDSGKGCYVGQEVVERVRSRAGSASQILTCIRFDREPLPGEEIFYDSQKIGILAEWSVESKEEGGGFLSLGLLRKAWTGLKEGIQTSSGARGQIDNFKPTQDN